MANLKRVEKRLENVEAWVKEFEKGTGPVQTMDNLNWLVGQSRMLGERCNQHESMVTQLQQALQSNNEILNKFLEENFTSTWDEHDTSHLNMLSQDEGKAFMQDLIEK